MRAVITAGGRIGGAYAAAAATDVKALAMVRGATMLARIVEALRGAGATDIAVVGGAEVRSACGSSIERFIDEHPSGEENILRALRAWPDDGERLLYATSDLPYVTAAAVSDFARRVPAGTLAIALTEFEAFARRFPGAPPFGIRLNGERVVNGGIFSIPGGSIEALEKVALRFFAARKQPWRMANLVSPWVVLKLGLGRLDVTEIERIAQRTLGVAAMGVRHCAAELAFDADTLTEYRYACGHA